MSNETRVLLDKFEGKVGQAAELLEIFYLLKLGRHPEDVLVTVALLVNSTYAASTVSRNGSQTTDCASTEPADAVRR